MRVFILILVACLPGLCQSVAGEATKPPGRAPVCIELRDQYDSPQRLVFPATNVVVLTLADKKGSEQVDGWVAALKSRYAGRIELRGLADVGGVPGWLRGKVRKKFQETRAYPVMMDWSGKVCAEFGFQPGLSSRESSRRVAACALPRVGKLCRRAELYPVATKLLNFPNSNDALGVGPEEPVERLEPFSSSLSLQASLRACFPWSK